MKRNWEYKKLGEVCTIERGGSPRPIEKFITDDPNGLNWIKIGDAVEGSKYITSTKEKIKPEGLKKTRLVHKGDFILSNSMSFGRPYILDIDGCIHDGWLVIHDENKVFDKIYLYYLLSSPNMYSEFKRLAVGGVVNNLNSQLVRNVSVAIPPLEEQSRIVAELDLLTGIIDKQNAQLKELDNLAQAIFYDMFGDPIENPKGWEVKKLEGLCKVITKGTTPTTLGYPFVSNGIGFVKVEAFSNGLIDVSKLSYVSEECNLALVRSQLQENDLLVCIAGATIGKMALVTKNVLPANTNQACAIVRLISIENLSYIYAFLKQRFAYDVQNMGKGVAQPNLSLGQIRDLDIPLPPLALQQSFAEKIQSIEKQKETIRASIADTQKLLDYTMDKYFG